MDETFFPLRETLKNGLSPSENLPPDSQYATTYSGMRPSDNGAESLYPVAFPVVGHTQTENSFLLHGSEQNLLYDFGTEAMLMDVELPAVDYLILAKAAYDNATSVTLDATARPHYIEHNGVWIITTGEGLITNAPLFGGWVISDKLDRPVPSSLCLYNDDRLLMAGFENSTHFSSDIWLELWNIWKATSPLAEGIDDSEVMSNEYIFYGLPKLGGIDLFSLELSLFTGYKLNQYKLKLASAMREGSIGFIKAPWKGAVLTIKAYQDKAYIYTEQGMGILTFAEGVPSIEQTHFAGLMGREAVGGDKFLHGGVDVEGQLFRVIEKFPEILGYGYLFREGSHVVSFDALRRDLYINTGEVCFILTPKPALCCGLYEVTSLYTEDNVLYGTFMEVGALEFEFASWTLNFKRRAKKTIQTVQIFQDGLEMLTCVIDYAYDMNQTLQEGPEKTFNIDGVVFPRIFVNDCRVRIYGIPTLQPDNSQVNNISVHWRTTDKAYIHGLSENTSGENL